MNFTLQHTTPKIDGLYCSHCDDPIDKQEAFKYVRLIIGKNKTDLHEECFELIRQAINKFNEVFILENQTGRIH